MSAGHIVSKTIFTTNESASDMQSAPQAGGLSPVWSMFQPVQVDTHRPGLEQECVALRGQNQRLTNELRQLRSLLSKIASNGPKGVGPTAEITGMVDNRTAAAEMLAALDESESKIALGILGSEGQLVSDILGSADILTVLRVTSMLANCRAALVHNESIVPTEFGHSLFRWIVELTQ